MSHEPDGEMPAGTAEKEHVDPSTCLWWRVGRRDLAKILPEKSLQLDIHTAAGDDGWQQGQK